MMKVCWSVVSIAGEGGGQEQHEEEGDVLQVRRLGTCEEGLSREEGGKC